MFICTDSLKDDISMHSDPFWTFLVRSHLRCTICLFLQFRLRPAQLHFANYACYLWWTARSPDQQTLSISPWPTLHWKQTFSMGIPVCSARSPLNIKRRHIPKWFVKNVIQEGYEKIHLKERGCILMTRVWKRLLGPASPDGSRSHLPCQPSDHSLNVTT